MAKYSISIEGTSAKSVAHLVPVKSERSKMLIQNFYYKCDYAKKQALIKISSNFSYKTWKCIGQWRRSLIRSSVECKWQHKALTSMWFLWERGFIKTVRVFFFFLNLIWFQHYNSFISISFSVLIIWNKNFIMSG